MPAAGLSASRADPAQGRIRGRRKRGMDLELAGKTVLITGGSKGIGRATAEVLADEGCNLILVARGKDLLEEAAAASRARRQVNVSVIAADLSSDATVRRVGGEGGGSCIFVNNTRADPPRGLAGGGE